MNDSIKNTINRLTSFFPLKMPKYLLRSVLIMILAAAAFIEFFASGLARRTFVFYNIDSEIVSVENRMLKRGGTRELNLTRYVEEALLGPISPDLLLLFPRETRLRSLLYRDGIVYADLSEEAVLPPAEGGEVLKNLGILGSGIKRNFPYVRDIRFFIMGKAVFRDELMPETEPVVREG